MLDPRLLVPGGVEAAAQRTSQGGQFQVVAAEQVAELAPAGVGEVVGGEVAGGIDLHAADAEPGCLGQGAAQGQAQRFQADADLEGTHGSSTHSRAKTGRPWVKWCKGRTRARKAARGNATVPQLGLRTRMDFS